MWTGVTSSSARIRSTTHRKMKRSASTPATLLTWWEKRRQTNFKVDSNSHWVDESFEIKVRNHKKQRVEVRVVEHLYRWLQWEVTTGSMEHRKVDARTIEFRPAIAGGGEAVIRYTVHYTW